MATPTEIVTAFMALWEKPEGFEAAVRDYFTPETVWENVGLMTTTGPEAALAFYNSLEAGAGTTTRIEFDAIAASGPKVLTERTDHILDREGNPAMSVRVMGIFEVANGKIAAWRDYFDTAGLQQQG